MSTKYPVGTRPTPRDTHRAAVILTENVTKLMDSATFKAALRFRRTLRRYSFRNAWLIYTQRPDATTLAGYQRWQELGRQVKKGETSLAIFAPLTRRNDEGELETYGFRTASVFDVSQTEGEPIPELPQPERLTGGNDKVLETLTQLEAYAFNSGFTVVTAPLPGEALGSFSLKAEQITLREDLEPLQRLKTLVHELAHALMHRDHAKQARHLCELEAEACAYIVCDALGLDTSRYSFPYLAHWAEDPSELLPAAEQGGRAAQTLLDALDTSRALTFGSENCRSQYGLILRTHPDIASALNAELGEDSSPIFMGRLEMALTKVLPGREGKRAFNRCLRLGEKAVCKRERGLGKGNERNHARGQ